MCLKHTGSIFLYTKKGKDLRSLVLIFFFCSTLISQTRYDIFIPLTTGDSLDATYFLPSTPPPANGYPVKLFVHGFGQSKDSDTASARIYAYSNYFTLCYSVRGHAKSSGLSTIMSLQERKDLKEVITFVENLPFVDSNSVGVIGGSQGGLHALWSVADSISNCAIADVIVPNWASDLFVQGAIKRMFGILLKNPAVNYHPVRDTLWGLLIRDSYDSLIAMFPVNRDLGFWDLQNKNIPLLLMLKYQDYYFEPTGGINFFNQYKGIKKLYLGTGGHFSDSNEDEWHYQFSTITNWFDQFLRNINTGILDLPVYTYAYSHLPMDSLGYFSWSREEAHQLPFNEIFYHRFYFHPDSTIKYSFPASPISIFSLVNNYRNTSYTFDSAYADSFSGVRFDSALEKHTITFISDTIDEDVLMFGSPIAKFFISPNVEKIPLNIQIYEQDNLQNKYFVSRINYVGRNLQTNQVLDVLLIGNFHAHKFKKGNRIRIEITNIDKTNRKMLGEYPFVFPVFQSSITSIFLNLDYPSYIEFPLMKSNLILRTEGEIVSNLWLSQNYPNPFNSMTNIEYHLPQNAIVKLEVYDILGRTVKKLFDGYQNAGRYKALFDSGSLPSGVYFYKLEYQVNRHRTILSKKMLLVR